MQSPSWVQWHGVKVHGVTVDRQTQYEYRGEQYVISNPGAPQDQVHHPTTVWLSHGDPTDSSKAYVDNEPTRWLDFSLVMVWFAVALAVVGGGIVRRLRRWWAAWAAGWRGSSTGWAAMSASPRCAVSSVCWRSCSR